jgi:predicted transcriptional regulator
MTPVMNQLVQQGIQLKMLISEDRRPTVIPSETPKNVEIRGLTDPPAIVVLTEKAAGVCFRQIGGRMDYAGFYGNDAAFHNWVKDLFLFYWAKGKRIA